LDGQGLIFILVIRIVPDTMNEEHMIQVEIFGKADKEICAGCDGHECNACSPGIKTKTSQLVADFTRLLAASELAQTHLVQFYEATPQNIARNADVERLLSMAELDPVICFDGKIAYLGGFSPEGLMLELRKKNIRISHANN